MADDKYTPAETALGDVIAILSAVKRKFPPGHRGRVAGMIAALTDLRDEIKGPRVKWRRYLNGQIVEVIEGRLLSAYSTNETVAILTDDGQVHERCIGSAGSDVSSYDLQPVP